MLTPGANARACRGSVYAVVLAVGLAGCAAAANTGATQGQGTAPARAGQGLPSEQIHGVAFNSADDRCTWPPSHHGAGVDMANPVGLIESTDAGKTWSTLSRQGQSDFHTVTASKAGVIGFDGTAVLTTTDRRTWTTVEPPLANYALAASPNGRNLLATSQSGPARSADGGATWAVMANAPLLQLAFFADDQAVVGVAPHGRVFRSADSGATWSQRGSVGQAPQALTARTRTDGELEVLVVLGDALRRSTDGGSTFTP